jgi:hypothetical protein
MEYAGPSHREAARISPLNWGPGRRGTGLTHPIGTHKDRRESLDLARIVRSTASQLLHLSEDTLATYLRQWLEGERVQLRTSTWTSYRMNLERHVIPRLGGTPLRDLTAAALNALYADLLEEGRFDGGRLHPRGDGGHGGELEANPQHLGKGVRAAGGERPAREGGAGLQDGRAGRRLPPSLRHRDQPYCG